MRPNLDFLWIDSGMWYFIHNILLHLLNVLPFELMSKVGFRKKHLVAPILFKIPFLSNVTIPLLDRKGIQL